MFGHASLYPMSIEGPIHLLTTLIHATLYGTDDRQARQVKVPSMFMSADTPVTNGTKLVLTEVL